jgi:hypothetical protein
MNIGFLFFEEQLPRGRLYPFGSWRFQVETVKAEPFQALPLSFLELEIELLF